jgi:hypothetical protein
LNTLDTVAAARRLVAFYVKEFNEAMPHSPLNGRTPDEVYFGKGEDIPVKLAAARQAARASRLAENRAILARHAQRRRPQPRGSRARRDPGREAQDTGKIHADEGSLGEVQKVVTHS